MHCYLLILIQYLLHVCYISLQSQRAVKARLVTLGKLFLSGKRNIDLVSATKIVEKNESQLISLPETLLVL